MAYVDRVVVTTVTPSASVHRTVYSVHVNSVVSSVDTRIGDIFPSPERYTRYTISKGARW
ncbi:hypothetical protein [Blueberry necrotic ring blotch virus]|uniref:Uncharacterized protein n=1 Tax=Blueberry necrotic ring blotch virus TaxID=1094249 RepID=G5DFC8_9VIRU|nr:hypothetical protein [Blueberry necrotic ring blotch virus]AEQ55301.1 hypothetical protein [Blueberry necrotic ring blotch virus]